MTEPLLVEIKGSSLDDGPGIRTVVFTKGCALACEWCHNPEAGSPHAELSFDAAACVGAGACAAVCAPGALTRGRPVALDRARCTRCFACVDACPSGALARVGRTFTVDELVAYASRYRAFYDASGGGVTLSGGEPTLHLERCAAVASALRAAGIRVLLETCGTFDPDRFVALLDPHLDEIYVDLKLIDDDAHRRWCGAGNARILANVRMLLARAAAGGTPVLPRVALIPDRTATPENLAAIAAFLADCGARRVALLDYNPLWHDKAGKLGATPRYARRTWLTADERAAARAAFAGFEIV